MEAQKDESRLAREHAVTIKRLELEAQKDRNLATIELRKLEAKWSSWLRLPSTVIKLPIYLVLALGYLVQAITKQKASPEFWKLINK